jgi:KUP system potassium uptake protein
MIKGIPLALTQNLKHNHVLHQKVFLVAVEMTETPRVPDEDRVRVTPISEDITGVELSFGFMERPDVPKGLAVGITRGEIAQCDLENVTYYTGHETIIPTGRRLGMARWRETLFAFMQHNAQRSGAYFNIPSAQIMEIGIEFEI